MDVPGDLPDVLEGDQSAEDGRSMRRGAETERRVGGGEMVAAEIEFVGHVAFARIDVLAVQVGCATCAVELLFQGRIPLVREVGRLAGDAGHRVHAPHGPVAPGRVEHAGDKPSLAVVITAGEQRLGLTAVIAYDEKGRKITATGSFYIGNYETYKNNGNIEILTDKETYESGDTLTAFISLPQKDVDVLLTYEKNYIPQLRNTSY